MFSPAMLSHSPATTGSRVFMQKCPIVGPSRFGTHSWGTSESTSAKWTRSPRSASPSSLVSQARTSAICPTAPDSPNAHDDVCATTYSNTFSEEMLSCRTLPLSMIGSKCTWCLMFILQIPWQFGLPKSKAPTCSIFNYFNITATLLSFNLVS